MDASFKKQWIKETLGSYGELGDSKPPFKTYIFPNLLDEDVMARVRDDINSCISLKPKDNDLYKFHQSRDLKTQIKAKKLTDPLHNFIDMMLGEVRVHLEKITGKRLSDKNFDITASRYDTGNYLLCHNDDIKDHQQRHGRALAFIYYLNSRPWTKDDGGALILYDSDSDGEPVKINNKILPRPNTLIVFETSPTSWHSVEEVYCKDDFRLSINGWFHSNMGELWPKEAEKSIEPCPFEFLKPINVSKRIERFFKECINQEYLMEKTCLMIRKEFKRKSEINLTHFLVKSKFKEICQSLKDATKNDDNLVHVGPYNKRNYRRLKIEKLPPICKDLYDAFRSELFFMLLGRLTGLELQPPSIRDDKKSGQGDNDEDDDDEMTDDDEASSASEKNDEEDDDGEDEESSSVDHDESSDLEDSDDQEDSDEDEEQEDEEQEYEEQEDEEEEDEECGGGKRKKKRSSRQPQPTTSKSAASNMNVMKKYAKEAPKKRARAVTNPLARCEYRHLETGSYTLIHDHGFELGESSALDVMLHFNHDWEVNFDDGGYICYIDGAPEEDLHDMDYELLTVEPKSNCLSLVYRCDVGTCRFLKNISKSHKSDYQDLYCVYYENPRDLPQSSVIQID